MRSMPILPVLRGTMGKSKVVAGGHFGIFT
uniref:Uncharacterized protein n=1 Tax=Anguilla anguilla TaxID=7936 RepID=A0A0E9TIL3_ANGAN